MPTTRDLELELDQRLQRYAASGMSRAGMLAQLTLAGYPTELLQQRFPEMSAVAFGLDQADHAEPRAAGQGADARGVAPGDPLRLAEPVSKDADRRAVPRRGPRPAGRPRSIRPPPAKRGTELARAEEGISFHYVPLIQCSFPHADPGQRAQLHAQERLAGTDARHHAPRNRIAVRRARATAHDLRRE